MHQSNLDGLEGIISIIVIFYVCGYLIALAAGSTAKYKAWWKKQGIALWKKTGWKVVISLLVGYYLGTHQLNVV